MKWLKSFTAILLIVAGIVFIINFSLQMNQEEEPTKTTSTEEYEAAPPPEKETDIMPVAKKGGMLRLTGRKPKTLNPLLNMDSEFDKALGLIFETLFTLDENQKPQPNIVERSVLADDAMSVTLILNRTINWHDGTMLTSRDVAFSINFIKSVENSLYKSMVKNIQDVTWTDEYTLKVIFYQPEPLAEYSLLFPILPESYYKGEISLASEINFTPIGCGAYKFVEYNMFEEIELAANDDYFKSEAYISEIKLVPSANTNTDILMYYELLVDAVNTIYPDWVKYSAVRGTNFKEYVTNVYDFLGINMDKPQMQDVRFRKAIAHLIPYEKIIDSVYMSYAVVADSILSPSHWMYNENVTKHQYNDGLAASYLKLLGLTETTINILVNNENEDRLLIAELIRESIEAAGLKVEIEKVDYETYANSISEGDFDIFIGSLLLNEKPEFAVDLSRYSDPTYNELLSLYRNSVTIDAALDNAKKLQKHLSMEIPYIGIAHRKGVVMVDDKIIGEIQASDNYLRNINSWFIK